MNLPHRDLADVPRGKVLDYLLSPVHPQGRHKAAFYTAFGFSREKWETLAAALKQHALDHPVATLESTPFGTRYIVEGIIEAPDGRRPHVRAVWFMAEGEEIPRFVTVYPVRGER